LVEVCFDDDDDDDDDDDVQGESQSLPREVSVQGG
jgi:hypothetical protein